MPRYMKWVIIGAVIMVAVVIMIKPFADNRLSQDADEIPLHQRINDYSVAYQEAREKNMPIFLEFYGEY